MAKKHNSNLELCPFEASVVRMALQEQSKRSLDAGSSHEYLVCQAVMQRLRAG